MDTVQVVSKMDFKTYYRMGLRNFYYGRIWMLVAISAGACQFLLWEPDFKWTDELFVLGYIVLLCGIIMPVVIYFSCKRNMKLPGCSETLIYQINNERIDLKGETISSSTTWGHVKKARESDSYFVLTNKGRSMHYLPKNGFESSEEMTMLKDMIRHNRVKAYLKNQ